MRRTLATLALLTMIAAAFVYRSAHSAPPDGISLMKTLSEWAYPGAQPSGDVSMSDAGIPPMQAVKCEAILTTPDPIEKVLTFYAEKLKKDATNTVSIQDDSKDRPVTQRVIVVNRIGTSTTLVISRAAGEKQTHITWSHCIRLAVK